MMEGGIRGIKIFYDEREFASLEDGCLKPLLKIYSEGFLGK